MERELEIHQLVWSVAQKNNKIIKTIDKKTKKKEHAANGDGNGYLVPMLWRSNASEDLNVEDE